MQALKAAFGQVRSLFSACGPCNETLGIRCLREEESSVSKVKCPLDYQVLGESLGACLGMRRISSVEECVQQKRSTVSNNSGRHREVSGEQSWSVPLFNNALSCARWLATCAVEPWAACNKLQPGRAFDFLTPTNKDSSVMDMLSSPRNNDPTFIIKAIKVDPTPVKPLCKYSNAGSWELQPITTPGASGTSAFVEQAGKVLAAKDPKLSQLGTGGAYFLSGDTGNTAVFKPVDEEPQALNNPRGISSIDGAFMEGLKKGTRPGEGAWKEYAAYLLDHGGLSGVPLTTMIRLNKPGSGEIGKLGSLQKFALHDYDAEECGTSFFPVHEVHKICVLDLRLANADRNGQNILVSKPSNGTCSLIPIDHGYAFPDCFDDISFEWMYYRQAEQPFCKEIADYINSLNPEHDIDLMEKHGIQLRSACLDIFRFSSYMLKWCVSKGFTAHDIATLMCKDAFQRKNEMPHAQVMFEFAKKLVGESLLTEAVIFKVLDAYAILAAEGSDRE